MLDLLFLLALGPAFPEAEAAAFLDGDVLVVDLEVAVALTPEPAVVVAHAGSSTNQLTYQLGPLGNGRYSGMLRLPARNQFLLIEAVSSSGGAEVSEAVTLTDLGISPEILGLDPDLGRPQPDSTRASQPRSPVLPILLVAVAIVAILMTIRVFRSDES